MKHVFIEGNPKHPTLILLHGTGGNETSLLMIGKFLDKDANILSIRGDIDENGMNRYFKRKSEGVYDIDDLNYRGNHLMNFIKKSSEEYNFNLNDTILVGFSNGANIGINLILQNNSPIKKAILMAPMYPVDTSHLNEDKSDVKVFISIGKNDPIVPISESENVIKLFHDRNAKITKTWTISHQITQEILNKAKEWMQNI